jgi:hypothetical protein
MARTSVSSRNCRAPYRKVLDGLSALALVLPLTAWGQDLRLLPCPQVHFFGEDCITPEVAQPAPPPAPPREPLFSPQTMAPDTPPLMLQLLEEPSVAHAHAFLAWQQARLARVREVQALLRALTRPAATPQR